MVIAIGGAGQQQQALCVIDQNAGIGQSIDGKARFTTWAQKVCVRVALTELRRRRWRDVSLDDLVSNSEMADFTPDALMDKSADPGQSAPAQMMVATVQRMIAEELIERQRTAMMAVMQG